MARPMQHQADPELDLLLERSVDVPPSLIWVAWTTPEHLKKWFTPAPWQTIDCEIDLRPGGAFRTVMRSPEGQEFPNVGCYLEIVENENWFGPMRSHPVIGRPNRLAPCRATSLHLQRSLLSRRKAKAPSIRRLLFMATKLRENATRKWDFTTVGARCSISW